MSVATAPAAGPSTRRTSPRRSPMMVLLNVISVFAGIGVWWVLALVGFKLPTPPDVAVRGVELIMDGTLAGDLAASLTRVLAGFVLGTLVAIPVGFAMGWYRIARGLVEPWVQFFRTIPLWRSSRWRSCCSESVSSPRSW